MLYRYKIQNFIFQEENLIILLHAHLYLVIDYQPTKPTLTLIHSFKTASIDNLSVAQKQIRASSSKTRDANKYVG